MEKLTLKELEQWFDEIHQILMDINLSLNNYERLFQSKYPYEDKIKQHGFFQHHFRQLRFIMIVQLPKLISNNDNQKLNLWKLLNALEFRKYDGELRDFLAETKLEWQFKSKKDAVPFVQTMRKDFEEVQPVIEKIERARNKVFAHYDPKYEGTPLSNDEIKDIVLFISAKFNELRLHIFGSQIDFRHMIGWEIDYVLREVSNSRVEEMNKIKNRFNK